MTTEAAPFSGWAILELMGHRRLGGMISEQQIAGAGFLRIDVPGENGEAVATQFYPPSSVYCLTPTTEAMARTVAKHNKPAPVQRWELPEPTQPTQWPRCQNCDDRHDPEEGCDGGPEYDPSDGE